MHPLAWLALLFLVFSTVIYYPTHHFLSSVAPQVVPEPGKDLRETADLGARATQ